MAQHSDFNPSNSTQELKEQARTAASQVKGQAREAVDQTQEKVEELAGQAKEQAKAKLATQKDQATDQLGSIRTALHQASDNLRDQDQDTVANFVDEAAQQIDQLTNYLQNHSISDLISEAQRYARREPALFLGGAALLGLFGARFLKSSSGKTGYGSRGNYDSEYRSRTYGGGYTPNRDTSFRERDETQYQSRVYEGGYTSEGSDEGSDDSTYRRRS